MNNAMLSGYIVNVLSANCQGLRDFKKRKDVLDYLDHLSANIICLQDTHWLDTDLQYIKLIWNGECFMRTKTLEE